MVYYNFRVLIGLQAMVYEFIYHAQIWCTRQREQPGSSNIANLSLRVFTKTVIPLALVGYEIATRPYIMTSIWPNCSMHASSGN